MDESATGSVKSLTRRSNRDVATHVGRERVGAADRGKGARECIRPISETLDCCLDQCSHLGLDLGGSIQSMTNGADRYASGLRHVDDGRAAPLSCHATTSPCLISRPVTIIPSISSAVVSATRRTPAAPDPMPTGTMSGTPQLLRTHHLKQLKLPTVLRDYEKVAREVPATVSIIHATCYG